MAAFGQFFKGGGAAWQGRRIRLAASEEPSEIALSNSCLEVQQATYERDFGASSAVFIGLPGDDHGTSEAEAAPSKEGVAPYAAQEARTDVVSVGSVVDTVSQGLAHHGHADISGDRYGPLAFNGEQEIGWRAERIRVAASEGPPEITQACAFFPVMQSAPRIMEAKAFDYSSIGVPGEGFKGIFSSSASQVEGFVPYVRKNLSLGLLALLASLAVLRKLMMLLLRKPLSFLTSALMLATLTCSSQASQGLRVRL